MLGLQRQPKSEYVNFCVSVCVYWTIILDNYMFTYLRFCLRRQYFITAPTAIIEITKSTAMNNHHPTLILPPSFNPSIDLFCSCCSFSIPSTRRVSSPIISWWSYLQSLYNIQSNQVCYVWDVFYKKPYVCHYLFPSQLFTSWFQSDFSDFGGHTGFFRWQRIKIS